MKSFILIVICLTGIYTYINSEQTLFLKKSEFFGKTEAQFDGRKCLEQNDGDLAQIKKNDDYPVVIHYGLNDSHSRSWAQVNKMGLVGLTLFRRFQNNDFEGNLIYKSIQLDGSENIEIITAGRHLEKSVLLFDEEDLPHIFVAGSTDQDQIIVEYFKDSNSQWQNDTIVHFYNIGGKFIYELSADTGPDYSFHLLVLKTRSNIDSDDFWFAWLDSYLYHLTNESGSWQRELIHNYDMAYTYDIYIKTSSRQDIKVDKDGYVHVTFSEQINATDDPSRLLYANNKTGVWKIETALNYDFGIRDDAGWFPSLCLDNDGIPYISCMYVKRVYTYSAQYCKLFLLKRLGYKNWEYEIIADHDDGYHGHDGRNYTGGLTHLVFDENNTPRIIFSDIASTHYPAPFNQLVHVGNIRYGVYKNGVWNINTIYRQPLPISFFNATEMYGMCLLMSDVMDSTRIIGQELIVTGENQYTSRLLSFALDNNSISDKKSIHQFKLNQNYPNPFNPSTTIEFSILKASFVTLKVYNILGEEVTTLVSKRLPAGSYRYGWDASSLASGVYLYRIQAGDFVDVKKMVLMR
jgi:hypothetical protein